MEVAYHIPWGNLSMILLMDSLHGFNLLCSLTAIILMQKVLWLLNQIKNLNIILYETIKKQLFNLACCLWPNRSFATRVQHTYL